MIKSIKHSNNLTYSLSTLAFFNATAACSLECHRDTPYTIPFRSEFQKKPRTIKFRSKTPNRTLPLKLKARNGGLS